MLASRRKGECLAASCNIRHCSATSLGAFSPFLAVLAPGEGDGHDGDEPISNSAVDVHIVGELQNVVEPVQGIAGGSQKHLVALAQDDHLLEAVEDGLARLVDGGHHCEAQVRQAYQVLHDCQCCMTVQACRGNPAVTLLSGMTLYARPWQLWQGVWFPADLGYGLML